VSRYMVIGSYATNGVRGLLKGGGTARAHAVSDAVQGLGGRLVSFDFAFGEADVYALVELPDNVAAATLGLAVSASGLVRTRTVVLLTPAEIDEAARGSVGYVGPGQ
jgi:uncharacterized protein with GYD domain